VNKRIIIGGENNGVASPAIRLSPEMVQKFDGKSKEVNLYNGTTLCHILLFCLSLWVYTTYLYNTYFIVIESDRASYFI
jgi:hypothetical protein